MGMFSEEIGGKRAAAEWVHRIESVVRLRSINQPLPIFGETGVLTAADMEALARRIAHIEVVKCCEKRERDTKVIFAGGQHNTILPVIRVETNSGSIAPIVCCFWQRVESTRTWGGVLPLLPTVLTGLYGRTGVLPIVTVKSFRPGDSSAQSNLQENLRQGF